MSKDTVLGRIVYGPQTSNLVRTLVRIAPDGDGVTPDIPDGTQLVHTSKLDEVIQILRDLSAELTTINPQRHPVKPEVMQRWSSTISDCANRLQGSSVPDAD